MTLRPFSLWFVVLVLAATSLSGCQTLRQISALKAVDFVIDNVNQVRLAGIDLDRVRSYEDLTILDAARITTALGRGELPLSLTVNVNATNPPDNPVTARLVDLDWTLLLDDHETISGSVNDTRELPPGVPVGIPIGVELDLVDFFDRSAQDLFELARAVAGENGGTKRIALEATPSIDTPIGPIRYPNAITIVSRDVGG